MGLPTQHTQHGTPPHALPLTVLVYTSIYSCRYVAVSMQLWLHLILLTSSMNTTSPSLSPEGQENGKHSEEKYEDLLKTRTQQQGTPRPQEWLPRMTSSSPNPARTRREAACSATNAAKTIIVIKSLERRPIKSYKRRTAVHLVHISLTALECTGMLSIP